MENSRSCDICNIDIHEASYAKLLRSKEHLENIRQDDIIISEWLFKEEQTPTKKKIKEVDNPKTLKQMAREIIKINVNDSGVEVAEKRLIHSISLMKV